MSTTKVDQDAKKKVLAVETVAKPPRLNAFVKKIQKRDGSVADFDLNKVVNAIHKAMVVTGEGSLEEAEMVANKVLSDLVRISKKYKNFLPTVEGIQDSVEKELILSEYVQTAKSYILYREKRSQERKQGLAVWPGLAKVSLGAGRFQ